MRIPFRILGAVLALFPATRAHSAWPADPAVNVPVCVAALGQQFPAGAGDGAGGAIVTWWDLRNGANFDIYAQRVLASGAVDPAWPADGRAVCVAGGDQQYPAIAADGAGGAYIVWCDARGLSSFDLYAQHVLASGAVDPAWPANGRVVCAAPGGQWFPAIAADGAGGAFVAWHDGRDGQADVYVQHLLPTGVNPAWPEHGLAVCAAPGSQEMPRVIADGGSGALVAWTDARGGANTDVYAQRVLAAGTTDPAWPANGLAVCTAPGNQAGARLVTDGAGGAIVTWSDARSGTEYDVYAQRVRASGAVDPAWPANGRVLCAAPENQSAPRPVTDGAGGAIVAWTDDRSASGSDVYAQRVLASGALDPAWPANGRALCVAPENQYAPDIAADGAGGAIVVWTDTRAGASYDLYAQHVLASGALDPAWPADGRAVSTAPGDQHNPVIVAVPAAAGPGSAPIVVWDDARSGNFDIYAQLATPEVPPGPAAPALAGVLDVKPDEGGFVTVSWAASALDVAPAFGITDYRVWRAGPAGGWQAVATRAAAAQPAYSLVVPTLADSGGSGPAPHAFVIEARGDTLDPAQHWFSAPDTGHSVDDLAPAAPGGLAGEYDAGTTRLAWRANPEPDVAGYRLYRGPWASFTPGPGNLVAQTSDTSYADPAGAPHVYKLSAVDAGGNESAHATFLPGSTAAVAAAPPEAFLRLAGRHPARGDVALRFGLVSAGRATLAIHDPAGRRVRTLASGPFAAGEHAAAWDGRDDAGRLAAPGLYFARLSVPGFTATTRIVRPL